MKLKNRKAIFAHMQAINQKRDSHGRFVAKYPVPKPHYMEDKPEYVSIGIIEEWFSSLWDHDRDTYMECIEALEKIWRKY